MELFIIILLTNVPINLFLNNETGNNDTVKFKITLAKLDKEFKIVLYLLADLEIFFI